MFYSVCGNKQTKKEVLKVERGCQGDHKEAGRGQEKGG
jgi:hypothetical protein